MLWSLSPGKPSRASPYRNCECEDFQGQEQQVCVCVCVCVCPRALEPLCEGMCRCVCVELWGGGVFSLGTACLAVHMHACEPPIEAEAAGPAIEVVIALGTLGVGGGELAWTTDCACAWEAGCWRGSRGLCTRAHPPTVLMGWVGRQWSMYVWWAPQASGSPRKAVPFSPCHPTWSPHLACHPGEPR